METEKKEQESLFDYYHFTKTEAKKYIVLERVFVELTPKKIRQKVNALRGLELPDELMKWIKEYDKIGRRNPLTWKRTYGHSCIVNFSDATGENRAFLENTKFLMFMFIILLDDVADVWQSKTLLDEILKIPYEEKDIDFNRLDEREQKYLKFTLKLWKNLLRRLKTFKNYKEFEGLLEYNIRQMLHGRRYGYLMNKKPWLINKIELQSYLTASVCSMQILEDFTIDFMFAQNLAISEYGKIRELTFRTQQMTRRGNWVSGWIKEIEELDFTSGVVAYALDEGAITSEDLLNTTRENYMVVVEKIRKSNAEKELLMEWEDNFHKNIETAKKIKSMNAEKYVLGVEQLLGMVLISAHAS